MPWHLARTMPPVCLMSRAPQRGEAAEVSESDSAPALADLRVDQPYHTFIHSPADLLEEVAAPVLLRLQRLEHARILELDQLLHVPLPRLAVLVALLLQILGERSDRIAELLHRTEPDDALVG